jgi:ADP-glucose pyrophosphorylase
VIDKNVAVPPGYRIGVDGGEDRDRFAVSDTGVVVVAKEQQLG